MDSERLERKSSAQAPYQFSQNEVSATVGHICGIAFQLTSEPLDLLLTLRMISITECSPRTSTRQTSKSFFFPFLSQSCDITDVSTVVK